MAMVKVAAAVALTLANIQGFRVPVTRSGSGCGSRGRQGQVLEGPNASIVNGRPARECDWVWQVALEDPDWREQFCGGVLIDSQWVLTAAHCVEDDSYPVEIRAGSLRANIYDQNAGDVRDGQLIGVRDTRIHPLYDRAAFSDYDIALLRLRSRVQMNNCVGTACLPEQGSDVSPGTNCWITGWGALGEDRPQSIVLQEVEVQTISNRDCQRSNYDPDEITDAMLCAFGRNSQGITDACGGDSGGPLVCESGGIWTVYGLTSWGEGCAGGARYPGVWARVHSALGWIQGIVR